MKPAVDMNGDENETRGRILCLTSTFPRWEGDSTPPFVLHLVQDLQALGWRVDVLAPHAPGSSTDETIDNVKVHRFRYFWPETQQTVCYQGGALINLRESRLNWLKLPLLVFFEWLAVIRHLVSGKYDLLHSHWVLPQGFVGVLVARLLRIPHVITVHGSDVFQLRGKFFTLIKRFSFRQANAVTVNSSATRDAAVGVTQGPDNFHLIPMGSDLRVPASEPTPEYLRKQHRRGDGPLLAFIGRVIEEKGIEDILQAIHDVCGNLQDITAIIIGDGQDRTRMEKTAKILGIADRVAFLGWLPQEVIPNYLAVADIFVHASRPPLIEAQGLSIIEAMLSRTPVIATRSGGVMDSVQNEITGLTVPVNAPEEIARAIERLANNPELAMRLAEAGHELARSKFTRDSSAKAFSDLFRSFFE